MNKIDKNEETPPLIKKIVTELYNENGVLEERVVEYIYEKETPPPKDHIYWTTTPITYDAYPNITLSNDTSNAIKIHSHNKWSKI